MHYKIDDVTWAAFTTEIGESGFDDIEMFSGISDDDYKLARDKCRASIVRKSALRITFVVFLAKYGFETGIIRSTSAAAASAAI